MLYVITGGPSCGKTTVIDEFARRGYVTLAEPARKVLEERARKGLPKPNHDLTSLLDFEAEMADAHLKGEELLLERTNGGMAFLDRACIDVVGYCMHGFGRVPERVAERVRKAPKYERVFVMDLLPFENDGIRMESPVEGRKIHECIIKAYEDFGYSPIKVPVGTSKATAGRERADFILKSLNESNSLIIKKEVA